jgi:hypothetical protein
MNTLATPASQYTFWDLAADFEDALRQLIEQGHPVNNLVFTVHPTPMDEEPPMSAAPPAPRFTLAWTSGDGAPIEPPLHQALLDTIPVKPATPNTQDPPGEWEKIYDYLVLRIQAHYSGQL